MKKIFVLIAVLVCTMAMLSIAASAVEINLVAPFDEEIQIAPMRDFYVVGTIDRNGMTPASLPLNVQIDLLDSKGNTVRTLKSNISPDGLTSAQFFMTDYDRGAAVNDDKGASLVKFTPPDIVFDGTDRDTIRLAHNKILVRENYFAAIIFGGASKGFDLLYTSADEAPLSDITAGEYALIITATDINGEVVATCRRVLNFGTDKERIVSFDNALIKDYAKEHNITVSNSIVGNWVPWDYIGKARDFSYTIQARFAENISKEYSVAEKVNILLYNLNPKDNKTNLKLGSSYASKAEKALLYYDIGEPDVKFNFNGTELSRKGEIVKHDENRFVEILRSETVNEDDIYADFNAKDGFVLTKSNKTDFYGVYSPIIKSSVFGVNTYQIIDDVAYVKYELVKSDNETVFEDYVNASVRKSEYNADFKYEFTFSITPNDSLFESDCSYLLVSLCNQNKEEIFSGKLIPIKINNSGNFIGNYDNSYWGKGFCDVINVLGQSPEGDALHPDEFITRGSFASMINRLFGYGISGKASFADLDETNIYYGDCATAQAVGYLTGDEKGRVTADELISREQAMIILARISQADMGPYEVVFKDEDKISFWAKDYVDIMSSNGIVSGFEGYLNPTNNITVAEASALIIKTFKWMHTDEEIFAPSEGSDASDNLSDVTVSGTEFISDINFDTVSEFYSANADGLLSLVLYIRKNFSDGIYISKVGNGLEVRDYRIGNFIKLSDEATALITAFSAKFAEFSIRYNPFSEDAVHFVLGRNDGGKLLGISYSPLGEPKNKDVTAINDNWYYFIQK